MRPHNTQYPEIPDKRTKLSKILEISKSETYGGIIFDNLEELERGLVKYATCEEGINETKLRKYVQNTLTGKVKSQSDLNFYKSIISVDYLFDKDLRTLSRTHFTITKDGPQYILEIEPFYGNERLVEILEEGIARDLEKPLAMRSANIDLKMSLDESSRYFSIPLTDILKGLAMIDENNPFRFYQTFVRVPKEGDNKGEMVECLHRLVIKGCKGELKGGYYSGLADYSHIEPIVSVQFLGPYRGNDIEYPYSLTKQDDINRIKLCRDVSFELYSNHFIKPNNLEHLVLKH